MDLNYTEILDDCQLPSPIEIKGNLTFISLNIATLDNLMATEPLAIAVIMKLLHMVLLES